MSRMAPGIEIHQVEEIDMQAPALQTITVASYYRATPLDPVPVEELQQRIDALLGAERHMRQRLRGKKKKPYDLRPLIYELALDRPTDTTTPIVMKLALEPAKTGRPDEVLDSLRLDPLAARLHRTRIELSAT